MKWGDNREQVKGDYRNAVSHADTWQCIGQYSNYLSHMKHIDKMIFSILITFFSLSENMVATLWLLSLLTVTLITVSECVYAPPPLVKYRRFDNTAFGFQVIFICKFEYVKFKMSDWGYIWSKLFIVSLLLRKLNSF